MPLKILHIKNDCTGCGACVSLCAKHALKLEYDEEGFYFPHLNQDKCVNCGACDAICHALNTEQPREPSKNYKAYMLKANDADLVKKSSSGGVFSLLANRVLKEGGVVYGARYNFDEERLEHCSTDNCSLDELRKSKYIESYMGETFRDVASQLQGGRKVLFCGTPCQVEGLSYYLKKRKVAITNLLLVRFVCHGVPANKFFTEYKHYEEKKHHSLMKSFDFRPKTNGWRSSDWKMSFENGKTETGPYYYYYYYYYYYFQLSNLLRRSCYSCKRVFQEIADITIGDFWGIHFYRPDNKDQDGISIVLVHSMRGQQAIMSLQNGCAIEEIPSTAVGYIYREAEGRVNKQRERDEIAKEIVQDGYMTIAKKQLRLIIIKRKISNKIYMLLKPIKLCLTKK